MTPSSLLDMFITLESIFAGTTIPSVEGMGFGLCSIASYKFYPLAIACVHVYSTCTFQECCKNKQSSCRLHNSDAMGANGRPHQTAHAHSRYVKK